MSFSLAPPRRRPRAPPRRSVVLLPKAEPGEDAVALLLLQRGQLLHQLLGPAVHLLGDVHLHGHVLVAARLQRVQLGGALAAHAQHRARLRALRHLDVHRAVDGLHCLLLVAQDGVREGDGDLAVHVHALTLEVRVLLDVHEDVEVAGGPALAAGVALPAHAQPVARLHAAGHLHLHLLGLLLHALPAAGAAVLGDGLAGAAAVGAGGARLEGPEGRLRHLRDHARAGALRAGRHLGAGLHAGARAGLAGL
mmetsp:Transcript_125664/g.287878  ORF Transcript_125664/g.287878 Transcript_125664/m.287878 type:complete len:251 (-) Transcript_125664:153-905(-)